MTPEVIQEVLEKEPFEPFRLCLSNGESYEVTNPHMVAIMKSKLFVAQSSPERWSFVSYLHIAAIETMTNGHSRGRKRRR